MGVATTIYDKYQTLALIAAFSSAAASTSPKKLYPKSLIQLQRCSELISEKATNLWPWKKRSMSTHTGEGREILATFCAPREGKRARVTDNKVHCFREIHYHLHLLDRFNANFCSAMYGPKIKDTPKDYKLQLNI